MKVGVSTACFYPMETEEALGELGRLGIHGAEVFLNAHQELAPAYCQKLRAQADGMGVEVLSVHPYCSAFEPAWFFSNYSRRFEDGREYYKQIYEAAAILGAPLVVFHGGRRGCTLHMEEYARRFSILGEDAAREGVILAHENVERCMGRSPQFFRELSHLLPGARYVLDFKQALRAGFSIEEMAGAMGAGLCHVHISDHGEKGDCLPLGEGVLNLEEMRCTFVQGTTLSMILELYREGFAESGILNNSYKILAQNFPGC